MLLSEKNIRNLTVLLTALLLIVTFAAVVLIAIAVQDDFNLEFDQLIGNKWTSATIFALSASLLALSIFQTHGYAMSVGLAITTLIPFGAPMSAGILAGSSLTELSDTNAAFGMIICALFWCFAIVSICFLVYGILESVIEIVWRFHQFLKSKLHPEEA